MTIFFFFMTLVNVIVATIKTIVTARSDNKLLVSSVNALAYGIYAIVVKQIATFPLEKTVVIVIISNLIGVTLSMILIEKLKKDKLWKISVTSTMGEGWEIKEKLEENGLSYTSYPIYTKRGENTGFDIFARTSQESAIAKKLLEDFSVKYHYSEVKTQL